MSPSPPTALLVLLLLVFVAVVCKETTHASALNAATTMGVSPQRVERIQRFLEKINKPAVKSIKSPDGDIIDCVLMNKQLALDHPLLKNHKIQKGLAGMEPCRKLPEGTVSVRRTTVEDVLRAGSLSRFGKKKVHKQPVGAPYTGHEYAIAEVDQQAYGTKAIIDVWDPSVGNYGEFSLSQIWLVAGSYANSDLNTIEAGWQDPNSGNWWLSYQNIDVGYWPNEIFTHLASYATSVQWGGEIVNNDVNGQHTTTQMGSGHFAEEGYRKASYFRNVEVVNSADALIPPQSAGTNAGNPNCYDIQTFSNANWANEFVYSNASYKRRCSRRKIACTITQLNIIKDIVGGIMSPSPPPSALLVLLLLVFVAVVCKETTHASALNAATTMGVSPQKLERIQRYLEKINKPAVKSIKGPDGDIIDCVLMDKQLALDHPLLKNHKIQRVAPKRPASLSDDAVPVQRTTVEDVLRAGSLSRFGKKEVHQQLGATKHEYAIAAADQEAYGTKAIIDVWNPTLQQKNEFSLSQIWVAAGSYAKSNINTIEVGWQAYPQLYGDNKTRLFIYWTSDAYVTTGCYNLKCPGFMQTNKQVVLGGPIAPVSTYSGKQSEKTFHVWKDPNSGNWWLSYEILMLVTGQLRSSRNSRATPLRCNGVERS
uniref:Neprosin PEP catalytic domain-containing protein n=1 Tax=Ananas comosus var. bracteatus TaxID=296719 RepID=A0A6V7PJ68_ANACO|nr:unnamed protein product [Ananas comosus var. bracteatus]